MKSFSVHVVLVVFLTACVSSEKPKLGLYQGTLLTSANSQALNTAVSATLSEPSDSSLRLDIKGADSSSTVDINNAPDGKSIDVRITQSSVEDFTLQADGDCFSSNTPFPIHFCSQATSISLQVNANGPNSYNLRLEYFGDLASGITLETPQSFTLDEAISTTLNRDFSTRIEFEHMMQAKFAAKAAYLNLMPHLSNSSIFGLATGGPLSVIGILGMAGDLAPFLFPSRWIGAEQAVELSDAEKDSFALIKGDAALQVESFAYSIDHDQQVLTNLNQNISLVETILQKTQGLESKGLVPSGTTDHMRSINSNFHDGTDDLREGLQVQHSYLSQAMGFINPQAVLAINLPAFPDDIDTSKTLQLKDLQDLVLSRSIELRQIDSLIAAAQNGVSADYFSWMDPSADVNHSLGFGLGQQINIDQSQVAALQIQRDQVASTLLQNLSEAITQYNHSLDDLDDSAAGIQLETGRLKNLLAALDSGSPVSPTEITSIPGDLFAWQVDLQDARLEYRSSVAKIQRLLLEAYYSNLDSSFTIPKN